MYLRINKFNCYWNQIILDDFCDLFNENCSYNISKNNKTKKYYRIKMTELRNRLNLLGYTLANVEKNYNIIKSEYNNDNILDYNKYYSIFSSIDVSKIKIVEEYDDFDDGEYFKEIILENETLSSLFKVKDTTSCIFYELLDPRISIRILCENPFLENKYLIFDIEEYENKGPKYEFRCLDDNEKILLLAEGKTDLVIISKMIKYRFKYLYDLFTYPKNFDEFPSKGYVNLSKYIISNINVDSKRKTICIFDNDYPGEEIYNKMNQLQLPSNYVLYKLPLLHEFESMAVENKENKTIQYESINGKQLIIECFLDYNKINEPLFYIYKDKIKIRDKIKTKLFNDFITNYMKQEYNKDKLIYLIEDIIEKYNIQKI